MTRPKPLAFPLAAALALATLTLAACRNPASPLPPTEVAPTGTDWSRADSLTVTLTDFAFAPAHIVVKAGAPLRLMLVNSGSGAHDFSAPAFFAAAAYKAGGTPPSNGRIEVAKGDHAEIDLLPTRPGRYPLECTEFLHSMFGMTGEITVTAPGA